MAAAMPYPNLAGKHAHDALFSPADFLAYARAHGLLDGAPPPEAVLLCYQPQLVRRLLGEAAPPRPRLPGHVRPVPGADGRVAVAGGFGIGAPAAAVVLEELVAWGVRRVVSVGTAGTLQPHLQPGQVVLCTAAIRDEGTSHHYLAAERQAEPSPRLTAHLGATLRAAGLTVTEGCSWTTDAPYRETAAEVRGYRDEGVLTVEMEAAALFAVARHRGVEVASVLVISDSLAEAWEPNFHAEATATGLEAAARAALEALVTS
jgi:uridine phosphorylase